MDGYLVEIKPTPSGKAWVGVFVLENGKKLHATISWFDQYMFSQFGVPEGADFAGWYPLHIQAEGRWLIGRIDWKQFS